MKTIDSKTHRTTGIGSLPHHNIDAALDYSFKYGIPFLPQIPVRNPWEFMIAQALEGLPGLQLESEGMVTLNYNIWNENSGRLKERLQQAFSRGENTFEAFEIFEPSATTSSCWQPFLWELQEKESPIAKVQMAGPMTCQWTLRLKDGSPIDRYPELSSQIFRLILARSIAMVRRMKSCQIQPILYLDEPGLYAYSPQSPKHALCLQELKLMIQTLRKEGALVGLHCCSNTHWDSVLSLGMDILSIDTTLSLSSSLKGNAMTGFIQSGGTLSLGIIPTSRTSVLQSLDTREIVDQLLTVLSSHWKAPLELIQKTIREAIYTPACGLALQSTSDAEMILEKLAEVSKSL